MEKERQGLENNIKVTRDDLAKKARTIEKVRSQIGLERVFLRKCESQYSEKAGEVMTLFHELTVLETKTRDLEVKRERMQALDYEAHRLAIETLFEKERCVALIHEFSIPRNVHRWDAIAAVDPTYVSHLHYHGLLVGKIDAAHRELIRLREVRDDLRGKLDARFAKRPGKLSRQQVAEYIAKYTEDVIKKDAQIEELSRAVHGNTPSMHSSLASMEDMRQKIVSRHGVAARLRTRSVAAMAPSGDPGAWFMTEVPIDTFKGGGFVARGTSGLGRVVAGEPVVLKTDILTMDNRARSSLLMSNSKKVTRPGKQGEMRSPPRAILLPLPETDV
jgi:hypothetical protein